MSKSDYINQAVIGTDDAQSTLQTAAIEALRRASGYMPGKVHNPLPETLNEKFQTMKENDTWRGNALEAATNASALDAWLQEHFKITLDDINNSGCYPEWDYVLEMLADRANTIFPSKLEDLSVHTQMPKVNGVLQLPKLPLAYPITDKSVYRYLLEWLQDRAWIAGSFVVSKLIPPTQKVFTPGDIDVFCYTDEAYEHLVNELRHSRFTKILIENDRSILFDTPVINNAQMEYSLNIVRPCGEDWSEPYNVLKDFDLTCSAALLKCGAEAYVWNPVHITQWIMSPIQIKHPIKTLERVFKYWSRGFIPNAQVWTELMESDHAAQLLKMISPLTHVFPQSGVLENLAIATGELTPVSSFDPYEDEYYYDDDQYDDFY